MTAKLLEVHDLSVKFGSFKAVTDVSLGVAPGEVVGVIGPNGAGKTTLVNTVFGVYRPASGAVLLKGRDLGRISPDRRARLGMARTFQNLELFGSMSVRDNILAHAEAVAGIGWKRCLGLSSIAQRRTRRDRTNEIMATLGLSTLAGRVVGELGYAERKLVEFGRAMVADVDLVLLDEPTAGIALEERHAIIRRMQGYMKERNVAAIVVEHDMDVINTLCHNVFVMDSGEIIAEGPFDTIVRDPKVREAYLGTTHPGTTPGQLE